MPARRRAGSCPANTQRTKHPGAANLFFFLALPVCLLTAGFAKSSATEICFGSSCLTKVEIADTPSARTRGLMYREGLADNQCLLFIFENPGFHSFWMKNMQFSIDIIWLDEDLQVVHIVENAIPCVSGNCSTFLPSKPAKYVLEVKAGFVKQQGLSLNSRARLSVDARQ